MINFFIVISCLIINAIFSAYEMAFVTISKEEIDELDIEASNLRQNLAIFKKKPERTLSVIQIGITLVGAIAAAVGGTGAVENLEPYLIQRFDLSKTLSEVIAVIVVILPLTYFSVVLGELVPKTIALRYPKNVLAFGTKLIFLIDKILSPIVTLLEVSTDLILKTLRLSPEAEEEVSESVEIGNLPAFHRKFVHNLIALKGKKINKIMIPWNKVQHLNFSDTDEEAESKIKHSSHSRFPVIDGETLVGTFHLKEWNRTPDESQAPWQSILGPALQVSEDEKILDVFLKMQIGNHHLAVVKNGSNNHAGLVSIEDILESIVGNIKDDLERNKISRLLSHRGKINFK